MNARWILLMSTVFISTGCSYICRGSQPPPTIQYVGMPPPAPPKYKLPVLPIEVQPAPATTEGKLSAMYESIEILRAEWDKLDKLLDIYR